MTPIKPTKNQLYTEYNTYLKRNYEWGNFCERQKYVEK